MSRVFDTPRYKNQTLYKMALHMDMYYGKSRDMPTYMAFGNKSITETNSSYITCLLAMMELIDEEEKIGQVDSRLSEEEMFDRYAALSGIQRSNTQDHFKARNIGKLFSEVASYALHRNKKIWTDSDATIRIVEGVMSGDYGANSDDMGGILGIEQYAFTLGREIASIGCIACRMGENVRSRIISGTYGPHEGCYKWKLTYSFNVAIEQMRMRGMSKDIHTAHEQLGSGDVSVGMNSFDNTELGFCALMGADRTFRMYGLNIIEFEDAIYVLDFSATDQVHGVIKSLEGSWAYATNYRVTGSLSSQKYDYLGSMDKAIMWIGKSLKHTNYSDKLPRSMKQSVALLQNIMHSDSEKLKTGHESKTKQLTEDIKEILQLPQYWHDFIIELPIPFRAKLDIANMYYSLPAPDCDIQDLFERATEYMLNSREVDWNMWNDFLRYCKSLDFCKVLCREKQLPRHKREEGYSFEDSEWYKRCMSGNLTLPGDTDLGKVYLYKHFPFNDTLPSWYWEAADVTRVDADIRFYESTITYSKRKRESSNELLYALSKAPYLSHDIHPNDVYEKMQKGTDKWDRIGEMAAKCENTKPGSKVRETWSADDITRELTSCYDRSAISLSMLYPGVTARRGQLHVQAIFDAICNLTRADNKKLTIIVSNDVSGWSPQADRQAWTQHHDYVCETTKAPESLRLGLIWNNIQATLSKRGFLGKSDLPKGLFQGWTGTMDTLLNVRMSLYCVRQARKAGFLYKGEAAYTAGLIDDAVQAVVLDEERGMKHCQNAADKHFEITIDTWEKGAAKIDTVKTLYSSVKFIFLNRFFCEGSEVLTPNKVFARADREFNRRFATVHSQMDTIIGSFRASVEKGACPIASYVYAISKCVRLAKLTYNPLDKHDTRRIINAAFAPRSMGGWGLPHIGSFLNQESRDQLSSYLGIVSTICDLVGDPNVSESLASLAEQTINQPFERCSMDSLLSNPWTVKMSGVPDPTGSITRTIKKGMLNKCTSEVFRDALQPQHKPDYYEHLRELLGGVVVDISILAMLGQSIPEVCSAALVDRAYKNELVTQLFPFMVRSRLSRQVKNSGRMAIMHLLRLEPRKTNLDLTRNMAFTIASDCRERFLNHQGLQVVNHTVPDYNLSLARQVNKTTSSLSLTVSPLVSPCSREGYDYSSLYDMIPKESSRRSIRTSSVYTFTGAQHRNATPVQRCINKGAILSAYVSSTGGHGKIIWDIICAAWGSPIPLSAPVVGMQVKAGASTKRLDPSLSHRSHEIACFKNSQACVNVDAIRLGRWLNANSAHVDFMSYVTAAKTLALVELASCKDSEEFKKEELCFGFLQDALPMSSKEVFTITNPEVVEERLHELRSQNNPSLLKMFLDSMVDTGFNVEEDSEFDFTSITYTDAPREETMQDIFVKPGYITNLINSGIVAPTSIRKVASSYKALGEEIKQTFGSKLATRFKKYSQTVSQSQAAITCMVENVGYMTGYKPNMRVMSAPWREVPDIFASEIPNWEAIYVNTINMCRGLMTSLSDESVTALLGNLPHHMRHHLTNLDCTTNDSALYITSYMYCTSHGRPRCEQSYTLMSAIGREYIEKCWRTAARVRSYTTKKRTNVEQRKAMASLYTSVADASRVYSHRKDLLVALLAGAANYLYRMNVFDIPPPSIPDDLPFEESIHAYKTEIMRLLSAKLTAHELTYTGKEIDGIINDIVVIDSPRSIAEANPGHSLVTFTSSTASQMIDIPNLANIIVGEDEVNQDVEPVEVSIRCRCAASAYFAMGYELAIRVLKGEEEYEEDDMLTDDDINEFLEEIRSYAEEEGIEDLQLPEEI